MAMINKQSKIAKLLTSSALAVGLGLAVVPTEKSEAQGCGFYKLGYNSYYTHCTGRVRTVVEVRVDYVFGNKLICVRPGTVKVGTSIAVKNAYYTGRLCR